LRREIVCRKGFFLLSWKSLAYRSAAAGWPTLLWDLDPQGAATYLLRGEAHIEGGAKQLVRGESEALKLVTATGHEGLDLLPSDFSYRRMDVHSWIARPVCRWSRKTSSTPQTPW
jgi:cellulose biosynthesis protein BcsQ